MSVSKHSIAMAREANVHRAIALGATLALISAGLYHALSRPINGNAAFFLHVSGEVLKGRHLYTDLIDFNPPLIAWLGIPVILLERLTGVPEVVIFPALVAIGATISLLASDWLSAGVTANEHRPALLVTLTAVMFVLPASSWGDREHIMLLLVMPYLMCCAVRASSRVPHHAWIAGIAAGLGFALKPHFVLAFLAAETYVFLKRREMWRGTFIAAGTIAVYGVSIILFTDYFPFVWQLRDVYAAYSNLGADLLLLDARTLFSVACLLLAALPGEPKAVRVTFSMAGAAWLIMAVMQGKGWPYHFYPALAISLIIAVLWASTINWRHLSLILAVGMGYATADIHDPPGGKGAFSWQTIGEGGSLVASGQRVLILTEWLDYVWPMVSYFDVRWEPGLASMWPINTNSRGIELATRIAVKELQAGVPVLVTTDPRADVLPILCRDPEFAKGWNDYQEVAKTHRYRLYRKTVTPTAGVTSATMQPF